jgi:hypothetical protein
MIDEAHSIIANFSDGIQAKLRKGALTHRLPEDMRSVLREHDSTEAAVGALFSVVAEKYRPIFKTDKLEFFVTVHEECRDLPSVHHFHTNSDMKFEDNPCAKKVKENGKYAIVAWNTCAPKVSADEFVSLFKCNYVRGDSCPGGAPDVWMDDDDDLPSSGKALDDSLRSSASKLSGKQYSSWQLVRFGYGWRGKSTDSSRFVHESPIGLNSEKPCRLFFDMVGPMLGDEKFELVIA